MINVMTLRKAIEEKKIRLGTEEIKYVPDYNEVKFSGQSTGAEKTQYFKTTELSWKLIELGEGQLALLAITSTGQNLCLGGKRAAENSRQILNNICSLWSCKKLDLVARSINRNDSEQISNSIKKSLKGIWLATFEKAKLDGEYKDVVYGLNQNGRCKMYFLYSPSCKVTPFTAEVRPIVYLPDDLLIDLETNNLYKEYKDVAKIKLEDLTKKLKYNRKVTDETINELMEISKLL